MVLHRGCHPLQIDQVGTLSGFASNHLRVTFIPGPIVGGTLL